MSTLAQLLRYAPESEFVMPDDRMVTTAGSQIAPADGRLRRQVQRRALAGLEPSPDQAVALELDAPRLEQNAETLSNIGVVGGSMLVPMGPVLSAIQAVPRAAGAVAGMAGGLAAANAPEAEAQRTKRVAAAVAPTKPSAAASPAADEEEVLKAIGDNVALKSLYQQVKAAEASAGAPVTGVRTESADKIRADRAAEAQRLRAQLNAELLRIQKAKAPFSDTAIGQAWPFVQALGPVAVGLAVKGGQNLLANRAPKALDEAIAAYEMARRSGAPAGNLMYAAGKVGAIADDIPRMGPPTLSNFLKESATSSIPATLAGATAGAELNLLPYQYDIRNAPVGSPAYVQAERKLGPEWLLTAGQGAGIGALGGQSASHLAHFGLRRPAIGEANNIRTRATPQGMADDLAAAESGAVAQAKALEAEQAVLLAQQQTAAMRKAQEGIDRARVPSVTMTPVQLQTTSVMPARGPRGGGGPGSNPSPGGAGPTPGGGPQPGGGPPAQPNPMPGQGNQPQAPAGPSPNMGGSSGVPYDRSVHTPISRQYVDEILAGGQPIPPASAMASELGGRLPGPVRSGDVTRRVNQTRPVVEAIKTLPAAEQKQVLDGVMGRQGFLAVPAAAGAGAAAVAALPREAQASVANEVMKHYLNGRDLSSLKVSDIAGDNDPAAVGAFLDRIRRQVDRLPTRSDQIKAVRDIRDSGLGDVYDDDTSPTGRRDARGRFVGAD